MRWSLTKGLALRKAQHCFGAFGMHVERQAEHQTACLPFANHTFQHKEKHPLSINLQACA
jgi:hypothetical protein